VVAVSLVRDVLDGASGSLVQSYDYAPYGAVAETNGSTPTDYQYAGLFAHPASGLNLSFTRPQDGTTGRWLGRDLIREAAGSNLYRYGPNTINGTDPLGLEFVIRLPGLPGIPLLPPVFWPGTPENQQFVRSQMQWIQWILNNDTADEPKAGSCPKPEDIQGKTPEEIDDMMEGKGWQGEPTSGEGGTRYPNPDVPGEQVRVMPGNPADPNPVKQGPYGRISTGGGVSAPIPLQGNPTLSR
jgi:RHS repeat-associated protein